MHLVAYSIRTKLCRICSSKMVEDDDKMEYEAEPIESIFVSFDEDNRIFYLEINDEYGFTLDPTNFLDFVNRSIILINEVIHDSFDSSIKSMLKASQKKALKKIEVGDRKRAVDEIETMLKDLREDNGPIAA